MKVYELIFILFMMIVCFLPCLFIALLMGAVGSL